MRAIDCIAEAIGNYCINNQTIALGQNLLKPSYISGLGKKLVGSDGSTPLISGSFDTTNSELTTVGYCIGRMIEGHSTLHVVKQQDFLYLAIDQFINSLCNNIDIISEDLGNYTIVCMISDWPFEGVQARSNNIELFGSLENFIDISYCHDEQVFKQKLNEIHYGPRILFLSLESTYHTANINWSIPNDLNPSICISLEDNTPEVNILVGFIPKEIKESIATNNFIGIINITKESLVDDIINVVDEKWGINDVSINIHEASTSKICVSYEIGWKLKETGRFNDIEIKNKDVGSRNNIALINQSQLKL